MAKGLGAPGMDILTRLREAECVGRLVGRASAGDPPVAEIEGLLPVCLRPSLDGLPMRRLCGAIVAGVLAEKGFFPDRRGARVPGPSPFGVGATYLRRAGWERHDARSGTQGVAAISEPGDPGRRLGGALIAAATTDELWLWRAMIEEALAARALESAGSET